MTGIELGLLYRPMRRVGVCIPGGAAAYPSSLLMTVVPAQAAGVAEIAVVVPPSAFGGFNTDILAACHALGVTEVYRIGGAQGVAALAYGLNAIGLEPVDKIVGPGNLFVALAKQHVFGTVDIDSIAGPSEVVVIADGSAVPAFVAADLISQAEHSPGASILLTWEPRLIDQVAQALEDQLGRLSRGDLARDSLERFGASGPGSRRGRGGRDFQPDRARAPARLDGRPEAAVAASDQRRRDLPGPFRAGGRRRLCRRAVARAADRRDRPVGVGPLGQRLSQAVERDRACRATDWPPSRPTSGCSPTRKGCRPIARASTCGSERPASRTESARGSYHERDGQSPKSRRTTIRLARLFDPAGPSRGCRDCW